MTLRLPMTRPSAPATVEAWHRVDVCNSTALARTRVSVIGVLDARAIATIDEVVAQAADNEHALTFELGEISSITPDALTTLLTRGSSPDGQVNALRGSL